jgi:AraC family transcriptional activator of mtrCDE
MSRNSLRLPKSVGGPFWRISPLDLDKLMGSLEVNCVSLAECALAPGAQLTVPRGDASTIHYGIEGAGCIIVDDEPPIRPSPHTIVIGPPSKSPRIMGSEHAAASSSGAGKSMDLTCAPNSTGRHRVGEGEPTVTLVCGRFQAAYGATLDVFASMPSPIVETFDADDQLDQVVNYAMAELAAREVGGGPMSKALLKWRSCAAV